MANIQIMNASLANKIAAGEVVERPASVIKELVENAIDAKSTKIDITLVESGIQSIRMVDNGSGMDRVDALLAFERHATSKLTREDELFRIHSLGFRGEALPSIASVSDVHLTTSDGEKEGTYVHIRGGKLIKTEAAALRKGTEVQVNNLFFNTPARLNYLKSESTELSYTIDYINKLAISHPNIAFKLVNNDRLLLQTSGNENMVHVLASIYGMDVAKKIIHTTYEDNFLSLELFFTTPDINRTTRSYMTLVINHRVVKNNELINAIIDGFESYLPLNHFPILVMNMTLDPLLVDVNVHPAKLLVRLSNEEHIKSVIVTQIRKKLKEMFVIPQVVLPEKKVDPIEKSQEQFNFIESVKLPEKMETEHHFIAIPKEEPMIQEAIPIYQKEALPDKLPKLYFIGQLKGTYLLAQNETGLYLIDQHAAQERINYEYYLRHFNQKRQEYYELLVPLTFSFSLNESLIIQEKLDFVRELAIDIESFGVSGFIVTSIPLYLKQGNEHELIQSILTMILNQKSITHKAIFNELSATYSCKRSIKANEFINEQEVDQLLTDLAQCDHPYNCPHGRPVLIEMSFGEIERLFKRVM